MNDEAARTLFTNQLKDAREEVADARATILARRAETAVPVSTPAVVTRSPQAQAALSKEGGDLKWFESYCSAAPGEGHENVDYLALKRLLHTVVEEQNETLYRGSPPVTMDSLVLTSKFQITLEATAGTHGIFRILPLLAAPNMELKADHVHTLKITLAGGKKKGDPNVKYQLSCEERLQKKTPPGGRGGRRWPQRWGLRQHRRAIARKHPGNPRVQTGRRQAPSDRPVSRRLAAPHNRLSCPQRSALAIGRGAYLLTQQPDMARLEVERRPRRVLSVRFPPLGPTASPC